MEDFITLELNNQSKDSKLYYTLEKQKDYNNLFWFYYQFEKTLCTDRFGYANKYHPLKYSYKTSLAQFPSFSFTQSFEWCVEQRIKEFIKLSKKENKKIIVSCSGGVDSVCVVSAFLLYGIDKKDFMVLYTDMSIEEYPWFFKHLQQEKIDCKFVDKKSIKIFYEYYSKNHILIFGNAGDQLYGSSINLLYPEWFHKSYKDFCLYCNATNNTIEQFEDVFYYYQLPIKEMSEFVWWLNFSIKHTKVCYAENLGLHIPYKFYAFFNTFEFDSWCCSHFEHISIAPPTEPKYYRPEEKAIIFKYTHDQNYIDTKYKTKPKYWIFTTKQDKNISYLTNSNIYTTTLEDFTKDFEALSQ